MFCPLSGKEFSKLVTGIVSDKFDASVIEEMSRKVNPDKVNLPIDIPVSKDHVYSIARVSFRFGYTVKEVVDMLIEFGFLSEVEVKYA